jgi:transcriptional regulator with XRE-family HTH domain
VNIFEKIWTKLRNKEYRKAFVSAEVKRMIPFQISAMRKLRGISQEELAKRSGLTQGVISRAEDPDYGNLTFNTVIKIANGFDVAFVGKFVPHSELAAWYLGFSEESLGNVPSFETEDKGAVQNKIAAPHNQVAALMGWSERLKIAANVINDHASTQEPNEETIGPLGIPLQPKSRMLVTQNQKTGRTRLNG